MSRLIKFKITADDLFDFYIEFIPGLQDRDKEKIKLALVECARIYYKRGYDANRRSNEKKRKDLVKTFKNKLKSK